MTLPPHGPPEITEAQQAATSLGEVADPTPDNVSRALQDYSPYAVASAAAALGAGGGGGGGGSLPSGDGSPVGVVTPSSIGGLYVDSTNGSIYIAIGATDADWLAVGGIAFEVADPGTYGRPGTFYIVGGTDKDTPLTGNGVALTDAYAQWNGDGAGLYIVGSGTDGQQELHWLNAPGTVILVDRFGTTHGGPGGTSFVGSDPHIVGAWWDNDGTLTRSSG